MSAHPTIKARSRGIAVVGSVIASLACAGVASADEPAVTQVAGNPTCASIDPSYFEIKVDNVREGRTVFGDGTTSGSVTVRGLHLDWSATPGVDAVIVKGGSTANVYRADDEMTAGANLHAPINPDNGRPYGISHVSFCSDGKDTPARSQAPTPTRGQTPAPCEPGGATTMPDGSACATPGAPAPQGEVRGEVVRGGSPVRAIAQMNAPSVCVSRSFVPSVRGKGIRRVTMFVNGKRVRTLKGARSRYAVTIDPNRYPSGVMRLKARVEFVSASGRRPQTFRMTVLRCAKAAVEAAPAFAG